MSMSMCRRMFIHWRMRKGLIMCTSKDTSMIIGMRMRMRMRMIVCLLTRKRMRVHLSMTSRIEKIYEYKYGYE